MQAGDLPYIPEAETSPANCDEPQDLVQSLARALKGERSNLPRRRFGGCQG